MSFDMTDNKITIKKYTKRINNNILVTDDEFPNDFDVYCGGDLIKKRTQYLLAEVEKLTTKAIYSQMTDEELKTVQAIISEILNQRNITGSNIVGNPYAIKDDTLFDLPGNFKDIRNEIMSLRYAVRKANRKNIYAIVLHPEDYQTLLKTGAVGNVDLMFTPSGNLKFMDIKVVTHNAMEENKIKFAFNQGEVDAFLQGLEHKGRMANNG